MVLDEKLFVFLLSFVTIFMISTVNTGGARGEHVHIKLHIPDLLKKHTHIQTVYKHHFFAHPLPLPKKIAVHHKHHHIHSHKSKSLLSTGSNTLYDGGLGYGGHYSKLEPTLGSYHSYAPKYTLKHYEPSIQLVVRKTPKTNVAPSYSKFSTKPKFVYEDEFHPSSPMEENHDDNEYKYYGFDSGKQYDNHESYLDSDDEYDESKQLHYYSPPLKQQPLHTTYGSSTNRYKLPLEEEDDLYHQTPSPSVASYYDMSQWDGLLSKTPNYQYEEEDDLPTSYDSSSSWPVSVSSKPQADYNTMPKYRTESHYANSQDKISSPKLIFEDFSAIYNTNDSGRKKWSNLTPSQTRVFAKKSFVVQ